MRYVIVDLEATCWEGVRGSPKMEIIEIGAVRLAGGGGPVDGEFSTFVRPVVEPKLSDFCRRLTSISQQDVDPAETFWEVFPRFVSWIGDGPFVLCSWGGYDLNQFRQDCQRHRLPLPPTFERHVNLKKEFARLRGVKVCGMAKALQIANIPLEGTHHRAADDARNIAKLATWILPRLETQGDIPAGTAAG
jgi:inhibitor of KinA sporulation pathway (predicted exonuclease)